MNVTGIFRQKIEVKPQAQFEQFNLRKYFSVFSIAVILILTVVLSYLVFWNQKRALIDYSISSAEIFAHQLNYRIYSDFIVPNMKKNVDLEIIEIGSLKHEELDEIAKAYFYDYKNIIKFKIYNLAGIIIYSSDHENMGIKSNSEKLKAALNGQTASKLTRRMTLVEGDPTEKGKMYEMDLLEVYIPIYRDIYNPKERDIIGVFEIYKDVSPLFNIIRREIYLIPLMLIFSMGALYFFLQVIINKADKVVTKQHEEIDRHNRELEEAQQKITDSIDEVIRNEGFHVRFVNNALLKCWEFKKCIKTDCASYKSENLRCWQVAGTFCGGKVQGYFANKYGDCRKCEVYQYAFRNRISMIGEGFNNMMVLLENKHEQLKELNDKLNVLVDIDYLTQVGNRRSFQKRIENIHLLSLRNNRPYSIIICDVDNFKLYNDTYGHQKGDYILISIANTMKDTIRRTDEIFRWGGEEFVIILQEQNLSSAVKVAENLRTSIQSLGMDHERCGAEVVTISVGIACNINGNIKTISWETVLRQADDELYKAKSAGKNCVYPTKTSRNKRVSQKKHI